MSPCLSLDGEREKTALLGLKTQIRHSLGPAGMPFSRCSRGQRSKIKGQGIRKTFGDRPSSKKADGEGQFLRPRLQFMDKLQCGCVEVWDAVCPHALPHKELWQKRTRVLAEKSQGQRS